MTILKAVVACLCAAMFVCTSARAEDLPEECDAAYVVAMLGTVMKSCPDLRVTAAGFVFTNVVSKDAHFERCEKPAKTRLMSEMVSILASVEGDVKQGNRLWRASTLATFEIVGGGLVEPK